MNKQSCGFARSDRFHSVMSGLFGGLPRRRLAYAVIMVLMAGFSFSAAGAVVGTIQGKFSATPAGAANYRIPIPTPGATAGLAPHVGLVYSSRAGNGLVGMGWQLAGVSLIARCPPITAREGASEPLTFTNTDRFCLDGQALLAISGNYGADGSTYVGERDGMLRAVAHDSGGAGTTPSFGPQWFTVYGPHGTEYEYGKTADSEVAAVNGVRLWALDRIIDVDGNTVTFHYAQSNGNLRPTSINYTGHGGSGATHRLLFSYRSLSGGVEPVYHNTGGAQIEVTRLLDDIKAQHLSGGSWHNIFTFSLSYQTSSTQRARLEKITECAADGSCFAPTMFTYQNGAAGLASESTPSVTIVAQSCDPPTQPHGGIFDPNACDPGGGGGGGSGGGGSGPTATGRYAHMMDVNGDGLPDLVMPGGGDNSGTWWVIKNTGSGFAAPVDTGIDDTNFGAAQSIFYNEDNKADLLVAGTDGQWQVLKATSNGFSPVDTNIPDSGDTAHAIALDFFGDGLTDLVYRGTVNGQSGLYLIANQSAQFVNTGVLLTSLSGLKLLGIGSGPGSFGFGRYLGTQIDAVADFNGDGRSDLLVSVNVLQENLDPCTGTQPKTVHPNLPSRHCPPPFSFVGTYWVAFVARGGQWNASTGQWSCPSTGAHRCRYQESGWVLDHRDGESGPGVPPIVTDVNGDGLIDMIFPHGGTWHVYFSTGSGFDDINTGIAFVKDEYKHALVVDWDGDGKQDVLIPRNGDFYVMRSTGDNLGAPDDTGVPVPSNAEEGSYRTGDVNGSGLTGLVWAEDSSNGNAEWHARAHKGHRPDLLAHITDGLGNTVSIDYAGMITTSAYTAGSGAVYPQTDFLAPMPLVTEVTRNDGVGGTWHVNYHYEKARANLHGRGFTGFGTVTFTDSRTGIATTTTYRQDWPYIGRAKKVKVAHGPTLLSRVANTWSTLDGTGPAKVPVMTHQIKKIQGISGNNAGGVIKTVTTTYSDFDVTSGNPGKTVVITAGGGQSFKTTTTVSYDDSASDHCLGLPNAVTITRSHGGQSSSRTTHYDNDLSACRVSEIIVDPGSNTLRLKKSFDYDGFGNVKKLTINGGTLSGGTRVTDYTYDSTGAFLHKITHHVGNKILAKTQSWDKALGAKTAVTDPNGATTTTQYDGFGRMHKRTSPPGASVTTTRTRCGACDSVPHAAYRVTVTSNSGGSATKIYDSLGRVLRMKAPRKQGKVALVDTRYNAQGLKLKVSASYYSGQTVYWTQYSYDMKQRPVKVSRDLDSGEQRVTSIAYDGLKRAVTEGSGSSLARETVYRSNALGHKISVKDAAGNTTQYTYTPFGKKSTITDPEGNTISYTYNERGFRTGMDDPDLGQQSWAYDAAGEVLSHTDGRGKTVTMSYDALGRPASRSMPGARGGTDVTNWTYDTASNGLGRLTKVTENNGDNGAGASYSRHYTYNNAGRIHTAKTVIGSTSYTIARTYDGYGRLKTVSYPDVLTPDQPPVADAGPDRTVYTGNWLMLNGSGSHDPDTGQTLTYHWSIVSGGASGVTLTDSDQSVARFKSNTTGNWAIKLTVSDGIKSDSDTLHVTVTSAPPPPAPTNLTATKSRYGNYSLSWSSVNGASWYELWESQHLNMTSPCKVYSGRKPAATFSDHRNGTYTYFAKACSDQGCSGSSNSVSVTVSGSSGTTSACLPPPCKVCVGTDISPQTGGALFAVRYEYDSNGMLDKVENANDTSQTYWKARSQAPSGSLSGALLGNGLEVSRDYDPATGHLKSLEIGSGGGVVSLAYTYNRLGELTQRKSLRAGLRQRFYYDSLGRIEQATLYHDGTQSRNELYTYDALGNVTSRTGVGSYHYTGSHPHAVTSAGGASYSYNAAGEMTSGAGRSYSWTAVGKPWQIVQGSASAQFRYGPGGHIYRQVRRAGLSEETTVERFSPYFKVIHKEDGTEVLVNRILVHGRAVALLKASGTGIMEGVAYLHRDRLGSVIAVTDPSGQVRSRSAYGVWGERVDPSTWKGASPDAGTLAETHHGYTGHKELAAVGLIHMGGRVYDPKLGRFVSADPTLQAPYSPQDLNRYSYVVNSPLNGIDPTGYDIWGDIFNPGNILGDVGDDIAGLMRGIFDPLGIVAQSAHETKVHWRVAAAAALVVFTAGVGAMAVAGFWLVAEGSWAVTGAIMGAALGAAVATASGGNLGDILMGAAAGAAMGYSFGSLAQGAYTAFSSKGGWGLGKWFGNQAMSYEARSEAQNLARKNGMSLIEFDALLFAFSEFGNKLVGSRYTGNFEGTGKPGIEGFFNRSGGWVSNPTAAKIIGSIFDVSDTLLAYQGIPTASGLDAILAGGSSLSGHSLGALDVGNLQALGFTKRSSLYAVPFSYVAPGSAVFNEWDDPVSGSVLGWFFNPDANMCSGWPPHVYADFSCGG